MTLNRFNTLNFFKDVIDSIFSYLLLLCVRVCVRADFVAHVPVIIILCTSLSYIMLFDLNIHISLSTFVCLCVCCPNHVYCFYVCGAPGLHGVNESGWAIAWMRTQKHAHVYNVPHPKTTRIYVGMLERSSTRRPLTAPAPPHL